MVKLSNSLSFWAVKGFQDTLGLKVLEPGISGKVENNSCLNLLFVSACLVFHLLSILQVQLASNFRSLLAKLDLMIYHLTSNGRHLEISFLLDLIYFANPQYKALRIFVTWLLVLFFSFLNMVPKLCWSLSYPASPASPAHPCACFFFYLPGPLHLVHTHLTHHPRCRSKMTSRDPSFLRAPAVPYSSSLHRVFPDLFTNLPLTRRRDPWSRAVPGSWCPDTCHIPGAHKTLWISIPQNSLLSPLPLRFLVF